MKLGTRPRYALRLMLEIARLGGRDAPVSLSAVAACSQLSRGYLEQLALGLRNAGLLRGFCGKRGGYRLTRGAEEITVGQIIEAAMGPVNIVNCVEDPLSCRRAGLCEFRPVYVLMNRRISELMHGFTLAQLLEPAWVASMKEDALALTGGTGGSPVVHAAGG